MERREAPAVRERAVRADHLPERHVGRAERERVAVELGVAQAVEAEAAEHGDEVVHRHHLEQPHGRHVERRREGLAHRDGTAEAAVVVLRAIAAERGDDVERRVVEARRRGDELAVEGARVEERLEARPRLALRAHAVYEARARQRAAAAHVGEHVAARVVHDQRGGVAHVALVQLRDLGGEHFGDETLQRRVERGGDARGRGVTQQAGGEVRRQRRARAHGGRRREDQRAAHRDLAARRAAQALRRDPAGARRDGRAVRVRRAQERDEQRRLGFAEPVRIAVEESARRRGDTLQFAPKAGEVEMRFEDLVLAPCRFERACGAELTQLGEQLMKLAARRWLATRETIMRLAARLRLATRDMMRAQRGIEQSGDLHRQRAGAAQATARDSVAQRGGDGEPVDAAVFAEAVVFRFDQRRDQHGRHVAQRRPREAAPAAIDAALVEHGAVTIEQHGLRSRKARAHRREVRERRRLRQPPRRAERRQCHERDGTTRATPRHGATSTTSFGRSPMRSGAYIASTRVGGSSNLPD